MLIRHLKCSAKLSKIQKWVRHNTMAHISKIMLGNVTDTEILQAMEILWIVRRLHSNFHPFFFIIKKPLDVLTFGYLKMFSFVFLFRCSTGLRMSGTLFDLDWITRSPLAISGSTQKKAIELLV